MADDLTSHPSISVNCQESTSVRKLDNQMDVDQPKRDFKISPENLYDSECHNKYVDSSPTEVHNVFIIKESLDQDCIAEVKETHPDAGFNHVEPSAMFLSKTRADEDTIVQFSADVNLSEHEQPALQERCRETGGNDIKDICIDEGIPVKEKIHAENIFKSPKHSVDTPYYPVKDEELGSENKVDAECRISVSLKSSTDMECDKDCNGCESKIYIPQSGLENETERLVLSDLLKENVVETLSTQNTAVDEWQVKTSVGYGCKDELDMAQKDAVIDSEVAIGKLRSSSPTSEETADESKVENIVMKTEPARKVTNISAHTTAVNSKDEKIVLSVNHPKLPDDAHLPRLLDPFMLASENLTASAPLQRDHFESSFASVGHYAGSVTYSGLIAHSGSVSHRSDASTGSTRSFAFPILQNEWNFSPVRMQKSDHRRLRRYKGWMHGLCCCKF